MKIQPQFRIHYKLVCSGGIGIYDAQHFACYTGLKLHVEGKIGYVTRTSAASQNFVFQIICGITQDAITVLKWLKNAWKPNWQT